MSCPFFVDCEDAAYELVIQAHQSVRRMQRVAIFGSPGSGKSTLARQLSARAGLPVFHLDSCFFAPGWVIRPDDEFRAAVAQIVATDQWITDGNYMRESITTGRIDRADTLILLDCPRTLCLWRVVRRIVKNYGRVRPDLAAGCPERFDWDFLKFVWNYPPKANKIRQALINRQADKAVVILRNRAAVSRFLDSIRLEKQKTVT